VAERSGDTAFARAERERTFDNFCPRASGVALRFPPHKDLPELTAGILKSGYGLFEPL
jgi:hypothetical protein